MASDRAPVIAPVASPTQAQALALELQAAVSELHGVVSAETELLKASDLLKAGELGERKSEAGRRYVAALEAVKINAVALARWAPQEIAALKKAQGALVEALNLNMTVLATARAVSESIVRSLAREIAAPQTLSTYGATGTRPAGQVQPPAGPLVLSRRL
jgi:IS1 family transposase